MHLSVDNVTKVFGVGRNAKCVLEGISFEVNTGEFVALVGSSGSGKSTVMRLVAGLERPTLGSISVDGHSVKGPGSDRGMVFQKYSLYPWLTAAQNVAFGMELQGLAKREIRERTSYFLDVVGLGDAARRLPRELSGGMQQRVAIARALAAQPKVLLLDEPFGALDLQIRESMQEFLHKLWQRTGLSALLITHDLEEALLLAQRVHIMAPRPGRIVRSVQVDLDHSNMGHLRVSPEFLTLREELAQCLRSLEPSLAA
ncbi:taurine import ATP-binding protein TauB [Cyanobium sp. PCC 7001]|uniref:ABC transporter ATP-binding protein n=1 Tax=Cyanobium sp. PCC 7001 TaxID=180281 RepID=UPI0001805926|nr:ABC transporter ATP-binding protein [Cyanobium sp. PCC 7001]EDY39224.1 taurine import ATP-binding protein TauB [Cyanobium sp. PCC 7001]